MINTLIILCFFLISVSILFLIKSIKHFTKYVSLNIEPIKDELRTLKHLIPNVQNTKSVYYLQMLPEYLDRSRPVIKTVENKDLKDISKTISIDGNGNCLGLILISYNHCSFALVQYMNNQPICFNKMKFYPFQFSDRFVAFEIEDLFLNDSSLKLNLRGNTSAEIYLYYHKK